MTFPIKKLALSFILANTMHAQTKEEARSALQLVRDTFTAFHQASQNVSTPGKNGALYESISANNAYVSIHGVDENNDAKLQPQEVVKISYKDGKQAVVARKDGDTFKITTFGTSGTEPATANKPKDLVTTLQLIKSLTTNKL